MHSNLIHEAKKSAGTTDHTKNRAPTCNIASKQEDLVGVFLYTYIDRRNYQETVRQKQPNRREFSGKQSSFIQGSNQWRGC